MELALALGVIVVAFGAVWLHRKISGEKRAIRHTMVAASSVVTYGSDPYQLMVGDSVRVGPRNEDVCMVVTAVDLFDSEFICQLFLLETADGTLYWLSIEADIVGPKIILWDGFVDDSIPEGNESACGAQFVHRGVAYDSIARRAGQYRVTQGPDISGRFSPEVGMLQYLMFRSGNEWLWLERFNFEGALQVRGGSMMLPGDIHITPKATLV